MSSRTAPRHRRHSLPMPFRQPAMSKRDLTELATRNAAEIADLRTRIQMLDDALSAAYRAAGMERQDVLPGARRLRLMAASADW
jgi:hypothetical protein